MSTDTTQAVTTTRESAVEFQPFGAEDKIKLTLDIVRKYCATPTKTGKLPEERDLMNFMMLCRSRRLDPFSGDAFLIGYEDRDGGVKWSLITSHAAFLKRATCSEKFQGMRSGVIVKDSANNIVDRVGDFFYDEDRLIGAWAIIDLANLKHPVGRRIRLSTFQKSFGQWQSNPGGMIVKCVEADALRSAFPTLLSGLYTSDEAPAYQVDTSAPAKSPDFGGRPGAPAPARRVVVSTSQPAQPANIAVQQPSRATGNAQNAGLRAPQAPSGPIETDVTEFTGPSSEVLKVRKLPVEAQEQPSQEPSGMPQDVSGGMETAPDASEAQGEAAASAQATPEPFTATDSPVVEAEAPPITAQADMAELVGSILYQAEQVGVTQRQIMSWCLKKRVSREGQTKLTELSTTKLKTLNKGFRNAASEIQQEPK